MPFWVEFPSYLHIWYFAQVGAQFSKATLGHKQKQTFRESRIKYAPAKNGALLHRAHCDGFSCVTKCLTIFNSFEWSWSISSVWMCASEGTAKKLLKICAINLHQKMFLCCRFFCCTKANVFSFWCFLWHLRPPLILVVCYFLNTHQPNGRRTLHQWIHVFVFVCRCL